MFENPIFIGLASSFCMCIFLLFIDFIFEQRKISKITNFIANYPSLKIYFLRDLTNHQNTHVILVGPKNSSESSPGEFFYDAKIKKSEALKIMSKFPEVAFITSEQEYMIS